MLVHLALVTPHARFYCLWVVTFAGLRLHKPARARARADCFRWLCCCWWLCCCYR